MFSAVVVYLHEGYLRTARLKHKSEGRGMLGLTLRGEKLTESDSKFSFVERDDLREDVPSYSPAMTPVWIPNSLTKSSTRLLGCIKSNKSPNVSSDPRCNSVSSILTSSHILRTRNLSRTAVSRWTDWSEGTENAPAVVVNGSRVGVVGVGA